MKASVKYLIAGILSFFLLFPLSYAVAQSYTSGTFTPQAAPVKKTPAQDFFGPNKLQSSIFGGKNVSGAEMFKPKEGGGTNGTFGKDVFASRLPSRPRPALDPNQNSNDAAPSSESRAGQQSDSFAVEDSNASTPQSPPSGAPNGEAIKEAMGDSEIQKVLEQTRKIKESVFGRSNELPEGVQSRDDIPSLPGSRKEQSNRF